MKLLGRGFLSVIFVSYFLFGLTESRHLDLILLIIINEISSSFYEETKVNRNTLQSRLKAIILLK